MSQYFGVIAMVNTPGVDAGAWGISLGARGKTPITKGYSTVTAGRDTWTNLNFLAHEMGHGFGLDHSYDDVNGSFYYTDPKTGKTVPTTCPGEYWDGYDIMGGFPHFSNR